MRKGFTLIELLVVIAIIAILAAILFPVFAKARAKARGAVCLSNLKQLSEAAYMYATDHEDIFSAGPFPRMPQWYRTNWFNQLPGQWGTTIFGQLDAYVGETVVGIWYCPTYIRVPKNWKGDDNGKYKMEVMKSYAINSEANSLGSTLGLTLANPTHTCCCDKFIPGSIIQDPGATLQYGEAAPMYVSPLYRPGSTCSCVTGTNAQNAWQYANCKRCKPYWATPLLDYLGNQKCFPDGGTWGGCNPCHTKGMNGSFFDGSAHWVSLMAMTSKTDLFDPLHGNTLSWAW